MSRVAAVIVTALLVLNLGVPSVSAQYGYWPGYGGGYPGIAYPSYGYDYSSLNYGWPSWGYGWDWPPSWPSFGWPGWGWPGWWWPRPPGSGQPCILIYPPPPGCF